MKNITATECCPKFNPTLWDEKTHTWKNKPFIKESIPTFFHFPFFPLIGVKIKKMWELAEKSHMQFPNKKELLILFTDPTPFRSEIYFSVNGNVKNARNEALSGTFISKVFEADYKDVPQCMKKMEDYLSQKKKTAKKYYIHYSYCPKCAKEYGNNYIVIFAEI